MFWGLVNGVKSILHKTNKCNSNKDKNKKEEEKVNKKNNKEKTKEDKKNKKKKKKKKKKLNLSLNKRNILRKRFYFLRFITLP